MDVLLYAAKEERIFEGMLAEIAGYTRKYTFFSDLAIAECYGVNSIKDTYNCIMKEWIDDIKAITEFVLAVNYKTWRWNGVDGKENLVELYTELYYKAMNDIPDHYTENNKESELSYFYRTLD